MSRIIQIQSIIENEISVEEVRSMVIMHKGEAYSFFDEGTTRYVFVNDDSTKVIKILRRETGFDYNTEEVKIYENANDVDKQLMTESTLFNGIVEQDYCTPIKFGGQKLTDEQRLFANSCRNEVGWTEDGNLVCFDLDEFKKH